MNSEIELHDRFAIVLKKKKFKEAEPTETLLGILRNSFFLSLSHSPAPSPHQRFFLRAYAIRKSGGLWLLLCALRALLGLSHSV